MKRRQIFHLPVAALLAAPAAVRAQSARSPRRIAALIPFAEDDREAQAEFAAFRDELRKLGWTDGTLEIEVRWAPDLDRIHADARELVALRPDAILARTTSATAAVLQQSRAIPVVFVGPSDPVGAGFVASLARPGGNATGFANVEASLGGKWAELLKEADPRIARLAVMFDPRTSPEGGAFYLRQIEAATRALAIETMPIAIADEAGIEPAIAALGGRPDIGLVVSPGVATNSLRGAIIAACARHRVAAVYAYPHYAGEGALIAYGIDFADLYRRAASYVDRILRGEKPADLAVQAPARFRLAVNLGTARALGLALPPSILARADDVID